MKIDFWNLGEKAILKKTRRGLVRADQEQLRRIQKKKQTFRGGERNAKKALKDVKGRMKAVTTRKKDKVIREMS